MVRREERIYDSMKTVDGSFVAVIVTPLVGKSISSISPSAWLLLLKLGNW